jgi:G-patch domain
VSGVLSPSFARLLPRTGGQPTDKMPANSKSLSSASLLSATEFRNVYQGVERESMGYRMLASMGWNEGDGLACSCRLLPVGWLRCVLLQFVTASCSIPLLAALDLVAGDEAQLRVPRGGMQGARKQGIKTHIKASKRIDNSGIGVTTGSTAAQQWTVDMHMFTCMLQSLPEITAASCADAVADPAPDNSPRSNQRTKKKSRVLKRGRTAVADCMTVSPPQTFARDAPDAAQSDDSSSDDEGGGVEQEKRAKVGHEGRYAKRELSKYVKMYSSEDLVAILGHTPVPAGAPINPCWVPVSLRKGGGVLCLENVTSSVVLTLSGLIEGIGHRLL